MPTVSLKPLSKVAPSIQYPNSGKAKFYFEASHPVDVFIVQNQTVQNQIVGTAQIVGIGVPTLPGVLAYAGWGMIDTIITFPEAWRPNNWYLVIGNPTQEHVAVYYQLNDAPK